MHNIKYLGIIASLALAYVLSIFVPIVWIAVIAALPLLRIRKLFALVSGFAIGIMAPLSLYLLYPLPMVPKLAGVISQIAGIPLFITIMGFPLFFGIIMGLGGLFWSGLAENIHMNKRSITG